MSLLGRPSRQTGMGNINATPIVVVGAGLAGLTAAVHLAQAGHRVVVHESRKRAGGLATTDEQNGFRFNQGPHALYLGGPADLILREMGVLLRGGKPNPNGGRVMLNGELHLAPGGPSTLLRTRALTSREKANVGTLLARLPRLDPSAVKHVTVSDWIDEHTNGGNARNLLHGLSRLTTYSSVPDQMSAEVYLSQLQLALGAGVLYLDNGWAHIVSALTNLLTETRRGTIEFESTISTLPDAPAVIVANGSAQRAGALLGTTFHVGPSAAVSCLDLGLSQPPPHDFVLGADCPFYLSNHSVAAAGLAPAGHHLVSVAQYLGVGEKPDPDAIDRFISQAGIREVDITMRRRLHSMTAASSIATAASGGFDGRPGIVVAHQPGVFLAGDWVGPVGHLADASVASGRAAANAVLQFLDSRIKTAS
jgi:phytoene dehydrogenase-like protein